MGLWGPMIFPVPPGLMGCVRFFFLVRCFVVVLLAIVSDRRGVSPNLFQWPETNEGSPTDPAISLKGADILALPFSSSFFVVGLLLFGIRISDRGKMRYKYGFVMVSDRLIVKILNFQTPHGFWMKRCMG